ncbi:hypothetical protein QBC46DRAFT_353751 [Diplogelasinospora grovesii]|uniref:Uncharacterized protein n=1 Tax=Diplogelasinospora grovesii TaxID=303347 RepID=A0AAN6NAX6_9PEZI|nr:hypothetical protein QBC46DRAFT_353751 [Diplogelasinospora grovesii]
MDHHKNTESQLATASEFKYAGGPLEDYLPGWRDRSNDVQASHGGHGVDEILAVVSVLSSAGIPSCVVGVRALYYYGAARLTDEWDLCVPDAQLQAAQELLLSSVPASAPPATSLTPSSPTFPSPTCPSSIPSSVPSTPSIYEQARPPPPIPDSLRHSFPCLKISGVDFYVILVPSSDCLVDPSDPTHVERSGSGVPYASLIQFAKCLLVQRLWADIQDFIDGMNLDVDWGLQNLDFPALQQQSAEFAELRNKRLEENTGTRGHLGTKIDMEQIWRKQASPEAKGKRIEPMKQGRYITRWRRVRDRDSDPRTRQGRPV